MCNCYIIGIWSKVRIAEKALKINYSKKRISLTNEDPYADLAGFRAQNTRNVRSPVIWNSLPVIWISCVTAYLKIQYVESRYCISQRNLLKHKTELPFSGNNSPLMTKKLFSEVALIILINNFSSHHFFVKTKYINVLGRS